MKIRMDDKYIILTGTMTFVFIFLLSACIPSNYRNEKSPLVLTKNTGVLSNFSEVNMEANLTPTTGNKAKLDFINFNSILTVPACGWYGLIEITAYSNGQLLWSKSGKQKQVFQQVLSLYEMKFSVLPDTMVELEGGNSYISVDISTMIKETKIYDDYIACNPLPEVPELVDWERIENPAGLVSLGNNIDFSVLFTKPEDFQSDMYSHTTIRLDIPTATTNQNSNSNSSNSCPFPTVDPLTESPSNSAFLGDRVKIQGTVQSTQCFRAVRIMIDGKTVFDGTSTSFSFEWNTQGYEAGSHQIAIETAQNDDPEWKHPGRISHTYQLLPPKSTSSGLSGGISAPLVRSPGNSAQMKMGTDVVLEWSSVSGAKEYLVVLWGGPYKEMTPCNWQTATTCRIGQMWSGTFYWKVMARNSARLESNWGGPWTFSILPENNSAVGNPSSSSSSSNQPYAPPSANSQCNISTYSLSTHQATAGEKVTVQGQSTCDFLKLSVDTNDISKVVNGPNASFTWDTSGQSIGGKSVCIKGEKAGGTWTFWCDTVDIRSNTTSNTVTPSTSKDCTITSFTKSAGVVTPGQTVTMSGTSTCDNLKLTVDTNDIGNVVKGPNASFTWNTSGQSIGGKSVCIKGQKAGGTWIFWCDTVDIRINTSPVTATPASSKDCVITSYTTSASVVAPGQTVTISGTSTCDNLKLTVDTNNIGNVVDGPNASFTWNTSGQAVGGKSVCIKGQKASGTWIFWCDTVDIRSNTTSPSATPAPSKDCVITSYTTSASVVAPGQTVTISGTSTCDNLKLTVDTNDIGNVVKGPETPPSPGIPPGSPSEGKASASRDRKPAGHGSSGVIRLIFGPTLPHPLRHPRPQKIAKSLLTRRVPMWSPLGRL